MSEFLNIVGKDDEAELAILLIPDIWGLTNYNQETAQNFANKYQRPCYILDYFYQLTGKQSRFDQSSDGTIAVGLMNEMTGEDFVAIFNKAISEIKANQANLKSISVVGFCFGGRLAYLTGLEKMVDKIVSFYGAGAVKPDFYQGKSAIKTLCATRAGDKNLKVLAFYGTNDDSITESDRETTKNALQDSQIAYEQHEYQAGHAYYQEGRPSYNRLAASQSNSELDKLFL